MNITNESAHYIEEDEIDLRELFSTVLRHKIFIAVFSLVITFLSILYALSKPNVYTVSTTLIPIEESKGGGLGGGLDGLAALAGVSVGGGEVTPAIAFQTLLNDQGIVREFIRHNNLEDQLLADHSNNFYFALGYRGIYDLFHSKPDKVVDGNASRELNIFNAYKTLKGIINISEDKKTGMLTLSATHADMKLAQKFLNLFLEKASTYLIDNDLKNIEQKLDYYTKVSATVHDIALKTQLSAQMSALIQSKVMLLSSSYYKIKKLTDPILPYYRDKSKPKRALLVVVSFVTSIILAIFLVFFKEFLKNSRTENEVKN